MKMGLRRVCGVESAKSRIIRGTSMEPNTVGMRMMANAGRMPWKYPSIIGMIRDVGMGGGAVDICGSTSGERVVISRQIKS